MTFAKSRFSKSIFDISFRKMSGSTQPLVIVEQVGKVRLIGINRPEKRNCINILAAAELTKAFHDFENDSDSLVAVLHGKGGNFCAGFDLTNVEAVSNQSKPMNFKDFFPGTGPMGPSRMIFKKPVIASVAGYAVAGGLELALMCDLRVVEDNAILGVFCRRFGVPLLDGGTVRLPQLIGLSRALDLILTGRPVNAKEALEFGLANRVVPTGTGLGEAVKLAQSLCKFPQQCMLMDRKSAYNSCFDAQSLEDGFRFEWNNAKHVVSEESVQGAKKFVGGAGKHGSFSVDRESKL